MQGNNSIDKPTIVCPKCGGKVIIELFPGAVEETCLNCGKVFYGTGFVPDKLPPEKVRGRGKVVNLNG